LAEELDNTQEEVNLWSGWYRVWLPRAAYVTVVVLAVVYGITWVFRNTSGFLVTVVLSVFAAFAMLPAVEALSRRGWRRGLATGTVMLGATILAALFLYALLNVAIDQTIKLVGRAPQYVESIVDWLNDSFGLEISSENVIDDLTTDRARLQQLSTNAASGVLGLASTAVGLLFQALTVGLFVFYILADLPKLRRALLRRMPPSQQLHADTVIAVTIDKVGGYVYSRSLLAVFSALFHYVAFRAIGIPYAVALAMWVGIVSQFVPTVGTYLAGAFPLLIALVEDPIDAIWVLTVIVVYQQVENYLLSPRITANTMDLHPAVAFGSAIIGASLLGGVGALLALPVAATLTALVQTYGDHYDVIASGKIESPEEYEARMQEYAVQKAARRRDRKERRRELRRVDEAPGNGRRRPAKPGAP
jgi:predicted PurR-regulated permease PerM